MKPQSMLFTIYGEYVRHYGSEIWVGSLTRLLGEFGLSEQAVRAAISRMQKQGWLESTKVGNRSYYSMSLRGQKRLDEAAARIYKVEAEGWNGKWCIASYNIPESQRNLRDQLRKELTFLGFGMLTTSTWISPNDLTERVKDITLSYGITEYVEVFMASHIGWSEPKKLVEKCWNLDEMNQAYQEFIELYQPEYEVLKRKMEQKEDVADSDCFVAKTKLVHHYRKFLFIDPDLPEELLPDLWLGKKADLLFNRYYDLLNPGAIRFFEQIYEPVPVPNK
ncbi:phenylacetic acid degradation operon negative regulatory protein PaaX [Aneurinibacillus aneurinilyticus]|uniref:Phenylacetic acid degradation operon negative regulatory protein PaaX n=2 Tax=Aneurinibacillus aneurinilyticus TaxID=1391 RepID=A0A848D3R1_ANEAE|nr:phenylacetic acid degradation operon negative regulatory protein PaaX [Aneurinibacillus aneurinilyticus]MCI1696724.1 phenylacetic acid degradation operon negative regulatory protein PaaX [Aneurinibacillus aneurinilyticus]MED0673392.1 phenylacetic acid degradation operon negative regulatory protein PaaX [Aneurinibacillus aneurinilyticus]MED0708373.1 phenylacetic acid degradation operon negative regulatory protein PaaX [Aneurinibacillus aneurinilyticus]MED0725157.1 phenylacetic acid degradatio